MMTDAEIQRLRELLGRLCLMDSQVREALGLSEKLLDEVERLREPANEPVWRIGYVCEHCKRWFPIKEMTPIRWQIKLAGGDTAWHFGHVCPECSEHEPMRQAELDSETRGG